MPKCINCPIIQAKLNDGKLCKTCFSKKPNTGITEANYEINECYNEDNITASSEKDMFDLVKDNGARKKMEFRYHSVIKRSNRLSQK